MRPFCGGAGFPADFCAVAFSVFKEKDKHIKFPCFEDQIRSIEAYISIGHMHLASKDGSGGGGGGGEGRGGGVGFKV